MNIDISQSDVERFYKFFNINDGGCWEWTGSKNKKTNRGRFWVDGDTRTAYIVSYIIHVGNVPDGLDVCHKCDNSLCVNPNHLFLGTNSDNMKDMFAKGRKTHKGEHAPIHKLTNSTVDEIKKLLGTRSQQEIAELFGVHQSTISHVATGRWNYV